MRGIVVWNAPEPILSEVRAAERETEDAPIPV
jgi:hypothetical protein